jgi:hypothetical protein
MTDTTMTQVHTYEDYWNHSRNMIACHERTMNLIHEAQVTAALAYINKLILIHAAEFLADKAAYTETEIDCEQGINMVHGFSYSMMKQLESALPDQAVNFVDDWFEREVRPFEPKIWTYGELREVLETIFK